jgi:UDP:flavonoid glycosyltransferase YjiC (YdhE family)
MRLLFTFAGGTGHFLPLVPIALTASVGGHEVVFSGQEGMTATVAASGFRAVPSGGATLRQPRRRRALEPSDPERELDVMRRVFAGSVARERAPALLSVIASERPDVVVCDEVDFGAMVAAERLGIPFATVACIASGAFGSDDLLREPLDRLRSEHGLPPDPAVAMRHRHLMLVPIPLALRRRPARPLPATVRPIRPAPVPGASPDWLDDLAGPVVSVTLGTIFNLESGDLFERILAGLAPLPVEVVATVGRELDPETLGPQHGSVRVEQFVAQDALLPRCAVARRLGERRRSPGTRRAARLASAGRRPAAERRPMRGAGCCARARTLLGHVGRDRTGRCRCPR